MLNKKRGNVFEQQTLATGQVVLKAHLPVQESFGKYRSIWQIYSLDILGFIFKALRLAWPLA